MSEQPFISICIPVYKQVNFLKRLLHSIGEQTFKDFDVIITDDTPDNSVADFIKNNPQSFALRYFKNQTPLGTPENWNEAIRLATGTWIKIMHGDDWFSSVQSLQYFADAAKTVPSRFIFSAYQNVFESSGKKQVVKLSLLSRKLLQKSRLHLFKANFVGNPSCTLIKREVEMYYDNRLKFVVDFEYYMRFFAKDPSFFYISEPLINVGIHSEQVTSYTFLKPEVAFPENHLILKKMGIHILENIFVYDYYWRLYRNLSVRDIEDIKKYDSAEIPFPLKKIAVQQKRVPLKILRIGFFSKILMALSYLNFIKSASAKDSVPSA